jgi:hypothetical protein
VGLSTGVKTLIDKFVGVAARDRSKAAPSIDSSLVVLFEPKVWNHTTNQEDTLRFSDSEFSTTTGHTPASTAWVPRFIMPQIRSSLGYSGGSVGHAGRVRVGAAVLFNPDGELDDYIDPDSYAWQGRDADILLGGRDWDRADFDILIPARIIAVSADLETIRVELESRLPLDQSFSSTLYGGRAGALSFNGTTSKVTVGPEYDPCNDNFTIEAWFKTPDLATYRCICQKRNSWAGASDAGYTFGITNTDQIQLTIGDGTTNANVNAGAAGALDDDAWHHVAISVDRTADEAQPYVDGVAYGTAVDISGVTGSIRDTTQDLVIGMGSGGAGNQWDGEIDEFRIWRGARSAEEIAATYLQGSTGSEEGLICAFSFDEYGLLDSGATALNSVGGPNVTSAVFDATGDIIDWGNVNDVTTGDVSWGIWFRAGSSDTGFSWLLGKGGGSSSTYPGYRVYINDSDQLVAQVADGSVARTKQSTPTTFRDGLWYAVVATLDRTADELVLQHRPFGGDWTTETAFDTSTLTGSLTSTEEFRSGRHGNDGSQFIGQVAAAFVSPTALSAADAQRVMDYGWFPPDTDPTDPPEPEDTAAISGTGYWPIDDETTTIADAIGSNNGTATGGVTWQDRDGVVANGTWISARDGARELAGLPKPVCLGRVKDAPGQTIEAIAERLVQFNTPEFGESNAVEAARVDGLEMTLGAAPSGDYTVDLADSILTLDSAIGDGAITVDVKGLEDGSGNWMRRTGTIANWVVATQMGATLEPSGYPIRGSGKGDYGALAGLDAAYPYEIGLYLRSEEYKGSEVLAALFQGGNEGEGERGRLFWAELFGGNVRFGALRDVAADKALLDLDSSYVEDSAQGIALQAVRPPAWKVLVGWQRVWHDFRDFLGGVSEDEQARMEAQYRWVEKSDPAIKTAHPGARVLRLPTLIYREKDAKIEAQILFDLFSSPRPVYVVRMVRAMFQIEIGDVVTLTDDRLGLDSGKAFMCIGYTYDLGGPSRYPTSIVELWGGF